MVHWGKIFQKRFLKNFERETKEKIWNSTSACIALHWGKFFIFGKGKLEKFEELSKWAS